MNIFLNQPIALFPLRLEIRRMEGQTTLAKNGFSQPGGEESPWINEPVYFESTFDNPEYWIRWFPDDPEVLAPPKAVSQKEREAFQRLAIMHDSGDDIFNLDDQKVKQVWRRLSEQVGPVRARYLASYFLGRGELDEEIAISDPLEVFLKKGYSIPLLPSLIHLYTIKNGALEELGGPFPIPEPESLRVAGTNIPEALWMLDFQLAVEYGMGIKIADPEMVLQIDAADWLIAFGVQDEPGPVEAILRGFRSRGRLSLVPQDTPTNHTGTNNGLYSQIEKDLETYLLQTRTRIDRGGFGEGARMPDSVPLDAMSRITENTLDAQILSYALQFDPAVFSEIRGADLAEQTEAGAMAMLVWRCVSDFIKENWRDYLGLPTDDVAYNSGWDELESYFVNYVRARGPLPVLRMGNNPYGILPVTALDYWNPHPDQAPESTKIQRWVYRITRLLKVDFMELSAEVPTLARGEDEGLYNRLLEILRRKRVSKRVDLRPTESIFSTFEKDPRFLTCPLVKDNFDEDIESEEALTGLEYLNFLAQLEPLGDNPPSSMLTYPVKHPDNLPGDDQTSLLHRLISIFIYEGYTEVRNQDQFQGFKSKIDKLKEAADCLRTIHPDKLEILLTEILDLLSCRLDAWITGLATVRLFECREDENRPTPTGVYGWLEKPGQISSRENHSEYIQTPSLGQAAAAALLRNASKNNGASAGAGPYHLNMSSDRVRKGLWYLEGLRKGHLAGELLGYRLERLLHEEVANILEEGRAPGHDEIQEVDIYTHRDKFRLPSQKHTGNNSSDGEDQTPVPTVIDGEQFLEHSEHWEVRNNSHREKLDAVAKRVASYRDAAADIAAGEMAYQFMKGNIARATAWMDFLDGDTLPPETDFTRTQRSGRAHSTRVILSVPMPKEDSDEVDPINFQGDGLNAPSPLEIGDPILNHLCNLLMPDWGIQHVLVEYGKERSERISISLAKDLYLKPIDLVVGGEEIILSRVRAYLLVQWKAAADAANDTATLPSSERTGSADFVTVLGDFPKLGNTDDLWAEIRVEVLSIVEGSPDGAVHSGRTSRYLEMASALRRVLQRNRSDNQLVTLDPTKRPYLPALIDPESQEVDREDIFDMISYGRVRPLDDQLKELLEELKSHLSKLDEKEISGISSNETMDDVMVMFDHPFEIEGLLFRLSSFGFSRALSVLPNDGAASESPSPQKIKLARLHLKTLEKGLSDRLEKLNGIIMEIKSAEDFESKIFKSIEYLKVATNQPGFPILVPYFTTNSSGWSLDFGRRINENGNGSAFPLDPYAKVRPVIQDALNVFADDSVFSCYAQEFTQRSRSEEELDRPEGDTDYVYFSQFPVLKGVQQLACVLLDEWAEFIPNREETTGVALQFPSPKTEAPNAVLLAVPPKFEPASSWSEDLIALTLKDTLESMQMRMVGSEEVIGDNNLGRYLPLLLFNIKLEIFPTAARLLSTGSGSDPYEYKLASEVDEEQRLPPEILAKRKENPKIGEHHE